MAFAALHRRFARAVHGVLLARVHRQEAEDLLQDVFLTAWRRIGSLREPASFGPWLLAVARSIANGSHRRARVSEPLPETAARDDGDPAESAEILAIVRALPATYRETLLLRLVEGLSGPEIAEATGLTHGSVRVNLHRGMQLLRERLRREGFA